MLGIRPLAFVLRPDRFQHGPLAGIGANLLLQHGQHARRIGAHVCVHIARADNLERRSYLNAKAIAGEPPRLGRNQVGAGAEREVDAPDGNLGLRAEERHRRAGAGDVAVEQNGDQAAAPKALHRLSDAAIANGAIDVAVARAERVREVGEGRRL